MEKKEKAVPRARGHHSRNTVWTDGSRPENKRVGAAFVWRAPSGWSGRRFHLGTNNEVFDAEVFAIYQELLWIEGL